MDAISSASWMLEQEARALLTRLARVKPFVLHETMVPAAGISPAALLAIEGFLAHGRQELRDRVQAFLRWLQEAAEHEVAPAEAQQRFIALRMRFNDVLTQFDLFADALTQRSEHETGVWLSGLDAAAAEALALPGGYYEAPPVICYLDRGPGAAIRRARTRLPGGGENPVAIIRVPRERMIGSGIASSLVHEVGHQGSALLDLIGSLRPVLREMQQRDEREQIAWQFWERWISEILADLWGVARVGVASTLGLISVVSLPRLFVFRVSPDDPHPIPWIRVKLSCAIGHALYPHPQWSGLARLWESYYPRTGLDEERQGLLALLEETIPEFVETLIHHRPESLRGASLSESLLNEECQPARLAARYQSWRASPDRIRRAPPSLVFAVMGQARIDGRASPEEESRIVAEMLNYWALRSTLDASALCVAQAPAQVRRPVLRSPIEFNAMVQ
ncbi:MAG: hypothetical protein ACREEM_29495 [Blastocatellia bacterium]